MRHDDLVEAVKEALNKLFDDTSVPQSTTRESLEEIRGEIDIMLETLDE
jgi:hypothetical protein